MKAAMYIEQTVRKGIDKGKLIGWGGYIYASKQKVDPKDFEFVKEATDQWGAKVKVYKAKEKLYLETPGGVKGTNLVILFT